MSVLIEFAMFPTDKGTSVSKYVSQIIDQIRKSGYEYQLTSMGTIIETSTFQEGLDIINDSYKILEPYSERIYSTVKFDIQKNKENRIKGKVNSIIEKIGDVNK